MMRTVYVSLALAIWTMPSAFGQGFSDDKFRQLEEVLPTPTTYRTASGAPGEGYWQQRADYVIEAEIDDENQRLIGSETITYFNRSPDTLRYLWLQLDQNIFRADSDGSLSAVAPDFEKFPFKDLRTLLTLEDFDGGYRIHSVTDAEGGDLPHTIVKTMMRIDLPEPLAPGENLQFSVGWSYNINDAVAMGGRTGYEFFPKDGNYIYEIAHWYPRMASYTDVNGWQHKQFLGRGEFTLELGDYELAITVPADHVVGATGVLQNPEEVLSEAHRRRLQEAEESDQPIYIVTPKEAAAAEASPASGKKTWRFSADNVRDVAFATSRKFIWDAQLHQIDGTDAEGRPVGSNPVMAMSLYPNEAEPLWSKYSTAAIIHTLGVYSRYTFAYPYPVAYSVNGPVGGMEYPMICFNGPRPEDDGTYIAQDTNRIRSDWLRSKYGLISVIIHEVGHNYFPMIVNSDERQWTWMDEGLNTFLQILTEQEWEDEYPSRRGHPRDIVTYMASEDQVPIMTNSESLLQFGNNAYAKPATALNILRETVLGRELFDFAFKEYARRWMFKRPMPADFFRTMEDASGVDLDWFWRGWFYSTDRVDIALGDLRLYELDSLDPDVEKTKLREDREEEPQDLTDQRYRETPKFVDQDPERLKDFYNFYDPLDVTEHDRREYRKTLADLEPWERDLLKAQGKFYVLELENLGGLVMPVILDIEYSDGSSEELRLPPEIWRQNAARAEKLILTQKEIRSITLDPHLETADVDLDNNHWPRKALPSRFQLFKDKQEKSPMQRAAEEEAKEDGKKKR
ncbi:MAG: M1 family metallopeptidase [Deltaproteobacteria bacterium]|nr:M1 family metallopeptidase [Deltaproteobacteria bacterium]